MGWTQLHCNGEFALHSGLPIRGTNSNPPIDELRVERTSGVLIAFKES
jgi:hypothetical protein